MGRLHKVSWRAFVVGSLAILVTAAAFVAWRASRALQLSRQELLSESEFSVAVHPLLIPANPGFETVSAPAVFLQAARFQDHLYIAGSAGLFEYDATGSPLRQFAVGRDLPSSPLVAFVSTVLADSREPELVIATAEDGLLAFNGRGYRQIYPQDAAARTITAIQPTASGHLLIGTKKRGVLLYDGRKIKTLHPTLSSLYVTALAGTESDLWIGTLDTGVLHWHAGATEAFGEDQGLPDRQVQAISLSEEKAFVGTVTGVAVFDRGRFSHRLAQGALVTSLLPTPANLFVGTEDQGVIAVPLQRHHANSHSKVFPELSEARQFLSSDEDVYVLGRSALYRMSARGLRWQRVLQSGPASLSDRNISALAADTRGRLWIGYFDRGLDILPPDSGRASHVENDHVFCVNRILLDPKLGTAAVATANGLVRFDSSGNEQQVLTRADGLIADHVTDVAPYGDGLAVATPAGLTFLDSAGGRSLYAFQGLINNHVYALAASGDDLMVGTLGGISVLSNGNVRAGYAAGSSGLKHNWITAIVPVGDEWMVGTYGAGILGLDRSGHFQAFEKATAPFEVNPNAMLVTSRHIFAGTLGYGLFVYDRQLQRWTSVTAGLPSLNVTALTESNGYIYVGTDNGLVRIQEQKLQP